MLLRILLFLFLQIGFGISYVNAKAILYSVSDLVASMEKLYELEVVQYTDSFLIGQRLTTGEEVRLNALSRKWNQGLNEQLPPDHPARKSWEGKWPEVGEKVWVMQSQYSVFLFARKYEGGWRFWDPRSIPFANTVFQLPNHPHYKPTAICMEESLYQDNDYFTCHDGFLLHIDEFTRLKNACAALP
ncbi:MAG: hypothetical protein ACFB10_16555 [Salibacteraceae bacterium]